MVQDPNDPSTFPPNGSDQAGYSTYSGSPQVPQRVITPSNNPVGYSTYSTSSQGLQRGTSPADPAGYSTYSGSPQGPQQVIAPTFTGTTHVAVPAARTQYTGAPEL